MTRLEELRARLGGRVVAVADGDPTIADVVLDSRRAGPGVLFAALPGLRADGAAFAADAVERGAVAVLAPDAARVASLGVRVWAHPEARRVVGEAAALVHGEPSRELDVVAVTGTNGKSSVAWLTGGLLEADGRRPAVLGTLGHRLAGGAVLEATHTTPDAAELQRLCARHRAAGGDACVLEASSHALDQERLAGLAVDVAVFTNLSRDHLDYHGSMERYAAAKERLFASLRETSTAVVPAEGAAAERMGRAAAQAGARVVTYGTGAPADLRAARHRVDRRGTRLLLDGMGILATELFVPLVGRHNVENVLAAAAAARVTGASPSSVLEGLAAAVPPPGRLEPVDVGDRPFELFVDYAHTPAALEHVLGTLRERLAARGDGRLVCLFGCGGDRDAGKRPAMGAAVARHADVALVTSDNPRDEDPRAIVDDVLVGLRGGAVDVEVVPDRREAIRRALELARPGDVVLLAGKGHERTQTIAGRVLEFDDRRVAQECLT